MKRDPYALPDRTMEYIDYVVTVAPKSHFINYHDAEDLRSECFLEAIKARDHFSEEKGVRLETFLEKAVRDAASRFFRDRSRMKRSCISYILDEIVEDENKDESCDGEVCTRLDLVQAPEHDAEKERREELLEREAFLATIVDADIRKAVRMVLDGAVKKDVADALGLTYGQYRYKIEPTVNAYVALYLKG